MREKCGLGVIFRGRGAGDGEFALRREPDDIGRNGQSIRERERSKQPKDRGAGLALQTV